MKQIQLKPVMLFLNECAYGANRVNARGHALIVHDHVHGYAHHLSRSDAHDYDGYLNDCVGDRGFLQDENGSDSGFLS